MKASSSSENVEGKNDFDLKALKLSDLRPMWRGFVPTLAREIPLTMTKYVAFDLLSKSIAAFLNAQAVEGALPIQVGVGPVGLAVSAASGAIAGIAGAIVSHPADIVLTKTLARQRASPSSVGTAGDWRTILKDLLNQDVGLGNLYAGLGTRATFCFLVIGMQFFFYDYMKEIFRVSSDDLSLVLDVFYAVRTGLVSDSYS